MGAGWGLGYHDSGAVDMIRVDGSSDRLHLEGAFFFIESRWKCASHELAAGGHAVDGRV